MRCCRPSASTAAIWPARNGWHRNRWRWPACDGCNPRSTNKPNSSKAQEGKVLFANAVETARTSILVGDFAKILKSNGIDIGPRRLFAWLREHGWLIKAKGSSWNMPTQKAMDLHLFEVKETTISHSDGHTTINKTPKMTGKGQTYFAKLFLAKPTQEAGA